MSKFIRSLSKASISDRKALFLEAREEYYNSKSGSSTLTDAEFDALEDSIRAESPKWKPLLGTGVKIGKKVEVKLFAPMPSLDKIQAGEKAAAALTKLIKSVTHGQDFGVSEKLDGSSIQAVYLKGILTRLFTRGDGVMGKDISFFIPHIKNLPQKVKALRNVERVVLRLEAIVPKAIYEKRWAGKFDSARAMASSLLNRQDVSPALKDLHFVVLRVLEPSCSLCDGIAMMQTHGFETVRMIRVDKHEISEESLIKLMAKWKKDTQYETDGLVICSNATGLAITGDRPSYAKAFKVNDEANAPLTTILRIQWQPSRHGLLVPKAIIKPIKFGNIAVKQAALHNANWAIERGCGVGAEVRVLRSGDIIPKIVAVEKKCPFKLPSKKEFGDWEWDNTGTALVLVDKQANAEVLARQFTAFFQKLELDDLASGMAAKLVAGGYKHTWELVKLLNAVNFAKVPGVKASAKKYAAQIQRIRDGEFPIVKLMAASGCFDKGMGETRLETLYEVTPRAFGKVFSNSLKSKAAIDAATATVGNIKGCGPAFAKLYIEGLPKFYAWMELSGAKVAAPAKPKAAIKGILTGRNFSWTGYRNKEEEAKIVSLGGKVVSFGGSTNVLFYVPGGKASTKLDKARAKSITVIEYSLYMKAVKPRG